MNLKTLTLSKSSFDLGLEMFEKFVNEVFSGGDEEQKAKLQEKWESVTKTCVLSERIKNKNIEINFPNELWLKIMTYLKTEDIFGSVALVNKHFNSLTHDSSLIKYLHIRNIKLTELDLQAYFVKNIDPNKWKAAENTKYSQVKRVLVQAKQLTELSIDFCDDGAMNMFVVQALDQNRNLKSLKINTKAKSPIYTSKFIPKTINGLYERFIEVLHTPHIQLEMLEFNEISIEPRVMAALCKIKTLKSIKVYSQYFISFTPEVLHILATADNKLQALVIDDKNILYYNPNQINDTKAALNHLLDEKKETLKCLKISGFYGKCDDPCVNLNFTLCHNLEEFDSGNLCSHDRGMISNLPSNLKKLRLAKQITNEPVMQLNLPHLTHLSLLCDESIEFSECHYLTSYEFPSLERLHLYVDSKKDKILGLDVFEKFLQNCPRVKSVQIDGYMYLDVPDEFLYKTFKDANVFVVQNSLVGNDILRRSQKSFEEFLLQEDPPMLIKYLKMKQNAKSWRANVKYTQKRFS